MPRVNFYGDIVNCNIIGRRRTWLDTMYTFLYKNIVYRIINAHCKIPSYNMKVKYMIASGPTILKSMLQSDFHPINLIYMVHCIQFWWYDFVYAISYEDKRLFKLNVQAKQLQLKIYRIFLLMSYIFLNYIPSYNLYYIK